MRALAALALAGASFAALAASYPRPPEREWLIGALGYTETRDEDTLVDISRRERLGYGELVLANPSVDRWLPGEGTALTLPTRYLLPPGERGGIVVNLAEFRLYYYPRPKHGAPATVETYAISAGREDWITPRAHTTVKLKLRNPAWYPPAAIRREHKADGHPLPAMVPAGPDNPLGPLALKLDIPGGYFIHGTSKPFGIGMSVTHGCLRLYPEDMEEVFARVPVGTPVRIVDVPYKTGWADGVLYLEAHPPLDADGQPRVDRAAVEAALAAALRGRPGVVVDAEWLEGLLLQPRGLPTPVRFRSETRG